MGAGKSMGRITGNFKPFLAVVFIICLLTGCYKGNVEKVKSESIRESNVEAGTDSSNVIKVFDGTADCKQNMQIDEKGYYVIVNSIMYRYDVQSGLFAPLCSKITCSHKDKDCDAYAADRTNEEISSICSDGCFFLYGDRMYMVENDGERNLLCSYNTSFSDKKVLAVLSEYGRDGSILLTRGAYTVSEGYLYYYIFYPYSEDYETFITGGEDDMIRDYSCMRIPLKENAVAEVLGQYRYPLDYFIGLNDGSVMCVIANEEAVYFMAGYPYRFYKKEDVMQYRIARYDKKENTFDLLYSYSGDFTFDLFGENLGAFDFNMTNTWLDGETIYKLHVDYNGRDSEYILKHYIVALNFVTGERKVIYAEPENYGISSVMYDGTYFYLTESSKKVGTFLKVVDKNGNVVRQYEFEMSDVYKAMSERFKTMAGEYDLETGGVTLLGVDNRYIVLKSSNSNFKNLSTDSLVPSRGEITVGIGLIDVEDFLSGKEVEIKQIYSYGK